MVFSAPKRVLVREIKARPRVLVVGDTTDSREGLAEVLRFERYNVTTAADGAKALARLRENAPDIVVLDLGLPGDVHGVEVLRAARACRAVPAVVAFTGAHWLREVADETGCDAFILKPDLDELLDTLRAIVAAREEVRRAAKHA